jgi:hypothetical protein
MSEKFTYEAGPRDKGRSEGEVSDFPEIQPGGEYQWSGLAHGQPLADEPARESDDGESATVVWYPKPTSPICVDFYMRRFSPTWAVRYPSRA